MNQTPEQRETLIQWAKDNYHQKVGVSGRIKAIWHPIVRAEMHRLRLKQMKQIRVKLEEHKIATSLKPSMSRGTTYR